MTLFRGKYRIESTRLRGWDYASAGWYFVTICTKHRRHFFGEVIGDDVQLSPMGEIVADEWQKTEQVRPNVEMDEWIVMPNHVHGIIVIKNDAGVETPRRGVSMTRPDTETFHRNVSTSDPPSRLKSGSLGAIIGQIKSICTKRIRALGHADFDWQPRFHDHIIRDEKSLNAIREYIINNPLHWERDRDNPDGLWM